MRGGSRGIGLTWAVVALALVGCRGAVEAEPPAPAPPVESPATIRIVAGGDVMFGRWVRGEYVALEDGPAALAALRDRFAPADLSLINLETGLCNTPDDTSHQSPRVVLTAPPDLATNALTAAGVDIAIVANNHALDCGPDRFGETLDALEAAGIRSVGSGPPPPPLSAARTSPPVWGGQWGGNTPPPQTGGDVAEGDRGGGGGGGRIHVIAVSERPIPGWRASRSPRPAMIVDHPTLRAELVAAVEAVRADDPEAVIVVSIHWGGELAPTPLPGQRALAEAVVEAGAQVVLGHHPHVVQPIEVHSGAVIAYSLGNLVFDMRQPESLPTGLLEVEIGRDGRGRPRVVQVDWHALLRDGARFVPLDDEAWLEDLARRSAALGGAAERVETGLRWTNLERSSSR